MSVWPCTLWKVPGWRYRQALERLFKTFTLSWTMRYRVVLYHELQLFRCSNILLGGSEVREEDVLPGRAVSARIL